VVQGPTARKAVYRVLGERGGSLFVDPKLGAGAQVVTEGRALLQDGDRVEAKLERITPVGDGGQALTAGAQP
jgi:hypothetical protein